MFKKLIVASEMTPVAFDVLKRLKGLAKLGASECLLVKSATYVANIDGDSDESLKRQRDILAGQGFDVETRVVHGSFRDELNRIAVEEGFSMIVAAAANPNEGGTSSGGFAHEAVHSAAVPVLLVRVSDEAGEGWQGSGEFNIAGHILFVTDFSANADSAFEYLKEMVAAGAKRVSLVHVQDIARINADISDRLERVNYIDTQGEVAKLRAFATERLRKYDEKDTQRLQEMKDKLLEAGDVEVDMELLYGSPYVLINKYASDKRIPLIVMGVQGRDSVRGRDLGVVSGHLAKDSPASVLLVPPQG